MRNISASLKNLHKLEIQCKYKEAIDGYAEYAKAHKEFESICNLNVQRILRKMKDDDYATDVLNVEKKPVEVTSSVCSSSETVLIDAIKGLSENWYEEYGPGSFAFDRFDNSLVIKNENKRFYIRKEIKLKKGCFYKVILKIKKWSGNPEHVLSIVNHSKIQGKKSIEIGELSPNECCYLDFVALEDGFATLRLGVGTLTNLDSNCSIEVLSLTLVETEGSSTNLVFQTDFSKEYIDPNLFLPKLLSNDDEIEDIVNGANKIIPEKSGFRNKKISIIIHNKNNSKFLKECLNSIVNQDYPIEFIEVIIFSDGKMSSEIEKLFEEYSCLLNLYLLNHGEKKYECGYLRNVASRSASGDYLLFINDDLLLSECYVSTIMSYHHTDNICLYVSQMIGKDGRDLDGPSTELDKGHVQYLKVDGSNLSISKKSFERAGLFNESSIPSEQLNKLLAYNFFSVGGNIVSVQESELLKKLLESNPLSFEIEFQNDAINEYISEYIPILRCQVGSSGVKRHIVPFFSIYIPVFNSEKYIDDCISSVLKQSFQDFEVVVVNDGSTDSTSETLEKYSGDSRIKVINKTNAGIGSASNLALKNCVGEYVVQLDSDDLLFDNALDEVFNYLCDNPKVECLYTNFVIIDDTSNEIGIGWSPHTFNRYDALVGMNIPHMRVFRRRLYHRTSGFDESLENAVDYDFYLKISNLVEIEHLNKILYKYRVHSTQTSSAKRTKQLENHVLVVNKFLSSFGFDDFYAKPFNPFFPSRNYVVRKHSEFERVLSSSVFSQPNIEGFQLPSPISPGNDYTSIQEYIREYYEVNPTDYNQNVSIVVPVYNRQERLSRCLAGICNQTYPLNLVEVIVVDDGSSDDVISIIDKYSKLLDIKYVKQTDKGYRLSAARNVGIRTATHENICIIDCDLIPMPQFVESFMQYLHHFDNVILLGHQRFVDPTGISDDAILANPNVLSLMKDIKSENSTMIDSQSGITLDWRYSLYQETNYLKNDQFPYRAFSSGHVAYKKKCIINAGFYDEDFNVWGCEDNETGYRLYQKGYYFIPVLNAIDLHQEPPSGKNETDREADRIVSRELLQSKVPATRGWFGKPYVKKPHDLPLVSICIPMYNSKDYVIASINSCLNQTLEDIEVVVYDDASTDGSFKIVKSFFSHDSRVRVLCGSSNRGVTFARNVLINQSRGEFVGFLDSDDLLEPNAIKECVNKMRQDSNVGLVCTSYRVIDESGSFVRHGWKPTSFDRVGLMYGNIFTHFRFFRIRDWNRTSKWNDHEINTYKYGEDWDLCLKLAEVCDFDRIDQELYMYRINQSGITNSNGFEFKFNQTAAIAKAWANRLGFVDIKVINVDRGNPHSIGYVNHQYFS